MTHNSWWNALFSCTKPDNSLTPLRHVFSLDVAAINCWKWIKEMQLSLPNQFLESFFGSILTMFRPSEYRRPLSLGRDWFVYTMILTILSPRSCFTLKITVYWPTLSCAVSISSSTHRGATFEKEEALPWLEGTLKVLIRQLLGMLLFNVILFLIICCSFVSLAKLNHIRTGLLHGPQNLKRPHGRQWVLQLAGTAWSVRSAKRNASVAVVTTLW